MPRKAFIFLFVLLIPFAACSSNTAPNKNAAPPAINPDQKDTDGFTPLMNAARNGDMDGAQRALSNGANVNAKTNGGFTPLMQAALTGQVEIAKLLFDAGADPTVTDIAKKNAADYALAAKQKEICDTLKIKPAQPPAVKVDSTGTPIKPEQKKK